MFCRVPGHGGRRAWHTTVSPTRWTPFPYRPMHVQPVWCWPACVWSLYGHAVAAALVLLVRGRVSRLLVCFFGVGSLALQRALAQSDLVRVGALLVSVLVGASCVGPAWYVFTVRCPPTVGERSNDKSFDRCKKFSNSLPLSLSHPGSVTCTTHHPVFRNALWLSFQLRLCHSRPHRSPLVRPLAPHGSSRVLLQLGGAVLVVVSACLLCVVSCRVSRVLWLVCLCRSAEFGG